VKNVEPKLSVDIPKTTSFLFGPALA